MVINSIDLDSDQNTLFTSLVLITFTLVMFWLLTEANSVAGGISSALRGMAQGAISPMQGAANVINRQSTRHDMQSGMMVTAGRLNHLAAGNTLVNPAYRAHVMANLGKNQGKAPGGKVKKDCPMFTLMEHDALLRLIRLSTGFISDSRRGAHGSGRTILGPSRRGYLAFLTIPPGICKKSPRRRSPPRPAAWNTATTWRTSRGPVTIAGHW